MGLTPNFSQADIQRRFDQATAQFHQAAIRTLRYLGEQCVSQARSLGSYRDVTGNLRSSVGYIILYNGQVISTNFSGNSEGVNQGQTVARTLAAGYPTGYVLVVVAGMNYAAKVESHGRDVLTSAEQYAQTELPGLLRDLKAGLNQLAA